MNTAFNQWQHLNRHCIVLSRDSIYPVCVMRIHKNGKHINVRVWFCMCGCVCDKMDSWIQNFMTGSIQVSKQAFPRKIGKKVRGVTETYGYRNVAYTFGFTHRIYGISALDKLCNWHAYQACAHTYLVNFCLKKGTCLNGQVISDQH